MNVDAKRLPAAPVDLGRVPYRFTADQVLRMSEGGVFDDEDVELWDGVIYKMVKGELHNAIVGHAADLIGPLVPPGYHLREEKSSSSRNDTLPEPDLAICRGKRFDYIPKPPPLSRLALVIEVSVTTHRADSIEKPRRYAEAGIPIYWQVDATARTVRVRSGPVVSSRSAGRYAKSRLYAAGKSVPVVIDDREVGRIEVASLFPPPGSP